MRRGLLLMASTLVAAVVVGAGGLASCGSDGLTTAPSASAPSVSSTEPSGPGNTSSIVPRADGTFMSVTPEEIVSAVVEVKPAPHLQPIDFPLDLSGDGRDRIASLVNGLRLSSEMSIEVLDRVDLCVELADGHFFYVIWFKAYPMMFKDFPPGSGGQMLACETVESAEMAAFLAEYGYLLQEY